MTATASNMLALGTKAPSFNLLDTVSQKVVSLRALKGAKATVVMFICNHCPFVLHVNDKLVELALFYKEKGVNFIAISSNDIENYPQDSPDLMVLQAQKLNYPFPYLYDETQEVAKAYKAACTPDLFVFDADLSLVYRGQFDDSRPGNGIPSTGEDLRRALDLIVQNKPVDFEQKPSIGCNIKWK
jgi:peroxiredoxin